MQTQATQDSWQAGNPYERFMGRWSRLIARQFLEWLAVPAERRWLDVGCGTGTLSALIFQSTSPVEVLGIDASPAFVKHAQEVQRDSTVRFEVASAENLPSESGYFDATISGLALNFFPQPEQALAEMIRVTKPGGLVAAYVWDYAHGMQMLRYFWDAAIALDSSAVKIDEGRRFPLCHEEPLRTLFEQCGLHNLKQSAIEVSTDFQDFDDYWQPFLGQVGPAPSYVTSLNEDRQEALRRELQVRLPISAEGTITLIARAWAIQGNV